MERDTGNELWPLRLRPCSGELFSSWLVRVARCYEVPVESFCRMVWPGQNVWHGDVDRQIDDEALDFLSRKTEVPYSELFSMTLRAHEQYAGVSRGDEPARDLYVQIGNTHAIRYCPGCLADREPYFRLEWRLAFVTVCPRHRVPLLERCDYCSAPCLFANLDVHRPFGSCHRCERHLAYVHKQVVDKEMALQIELHADFQQNLLHVLRKPHPVR